MALPMQRAALQPGETALDGSTKPRAVEHEPMTDTSSLAVETSRCFRGISEVAKILSASADGMVPVSDLEDQLGRLRVWSSNIGALAKGPASLDHRLRESSTMWQNVSKLLVEMQMHLQEMLAVLHEDRIPFEQQNATALDADDVLSSASEGSQSSNESDVPATELEQRYRDVSNIIDHLFKLSVKIRGPVSRARTAKAAAHRRLDPETEVDLFDSFKDIDRAYVRQAIADARKENKAAELKSDTLVDRFGSAITARRRQFGYWQKHHRKLAVLSGERVVVPRATNAEPERYELHGNDLKAAGKSPLNYASSRLHSEKSKPVTFISGTEATAYLPTHEDDGEDARSEVSVATTAIDVKGVKAGVPPPPTGSYSKEFECSLCFAMCRPKFSRDRIWRSHVFHDLQPYMCTYEDCHEGDRIYASRRFWLEHECRAHRSVWRCPSHPKEFFQSKASFEKHLELYCNTDLAAEEKEKLGIASMTTTEDDRLQCPICAIEVSVTTGFHNHLANHLERFAVFAIPRSLFSTDVEDGDSNASQQARPRSIESDQSEISELSWHSPEPEHIGEVSTEDQRSDGSLLEDAIGDPTTTPLHDAAKNDDTVAIEKLLAEGFDVNAEIKDHVSAIELAALHGHDRAVQLLFEHSAKTRHHGRYGNVLQAASRGGHESIVEFLLGRGVDVNFQAGEYDTALQAASHFGHEAIVKQLILSGAYVRPHEDYCGSPLQAACSKGYLTIASLLIDQGADINADSSLYGTPLLAASRGGYDTIVRLLVDKGVDVNKQDVNGSNALTVASHKGYKTIVQLLLDSRAYVDNHDEVYGGALTTASKEGFHTIVQMLLDAGADVNAHAGLAGYALHAACISGHESIVQLLLQKRANVNADEGTRGSALHAACQAPDFTIVQLLIENGADVNAEGGYFGTALQAAAYTGNQFAVQFLLMHGANVNAQGGAYANALTAAIQSGSEVIMQTLIAAGADVNNTVGDKRSALTTAAELGHDRIVKILLQHHASTDNVSGVRDGPLQAAARHGQNDIIKLLLEAQADVNAVGESSLTALHLVTIDKNVEMAQVLLLEGANPDIQDAEGDTALHIASKTGLDEIVNLIVKHGGNVDIPSNTGNTALMEASKHGYPDIVDLLIDSRADIGAQDEDGNMSLQLASAQGHANVVERLLRRLETQAEHSFADDTQTQRRRFGIDTALREASRNGHVDVVRMLIQHGAHVNARDDSGFTMPYANCLPRVPNGHVPPEAESSLQAASAYGHLNVVRLLLNLEVSAYQRPDVTNDEASLFRELDVNVALRAASQWGHVHIVRLLLEKGAHAQWGESIYPNSIILATRAKHLEVVKLLILYGADVNSISPEGSVLQAAISTNEAEIVKVLLESEANVGGIDEKTNPLCNAARIGSLEIVELLLNHGAPVDEPDWDPEYEDTGTALFIASSRGFDDITRVLLAHDVEPNTLGYTSISPYLMSPLEGACFKSHTSIAEMLLKAGAQVEGHVGSEKAPLFIAAERGDIETVKVLVKHGANFNLIYDEQGTALHVVSASGQSEITEMLIENGASLDLDLPKIGTALEAASRNGHFEVVRILMQGGASLGKNPLGAAAGGGYVTIVKYLLETFPKKMDADDIRNSLYEASERGHMDVVEQLVIHEDSIDLPPLIVSHAFTIAVAAGHVQTVKLFLDYGVPVNAEGTHGTALTCAARDGRFAVVQLLLDRGADVNEGDDISTPIQRASARGHAEVVQLLLDRGANVNTTTRDYGTPLYEAVAAGHFEVAKILLDYEADVHARTHAHPSAIEAALKKEDHEMIALLRGHDTIPYISKEEMATRLQAQKKRQGSTRSGR